MDLPFRLLQPFLGPRIVKTGLAVFLSLAIFHWFGSAYATFAAVASVLAVQPTVGKARETFRQQLLGNAVAGVVATTLGLWLPINPLTMALGSILVLGLLVRFKLTDAAGLAVVVILFIMDRPEQDFIMYTGARVGAIAGGMAIGHLVNRFISPPDIAARVQQEIMDGVRQMNEFIQKLIQSLPIPEQYRKEEIKADAAAIQKHLATARAYLELATTEVSPSRLELLKKANASMFVFTEAIMDIHKLVLQTGGLGEGPERSALTAALQAILHYKEMVMQRALAEAPADPEAAQRYEQALAELQRLVEGLIDQRESRAFGLQLHQVVAEIRHMGWRMASLSRLSG